MSSTARAGRPSFLQQAFAENASNMPLYALLGIAFVLRVLFLHDSGFHNDVQAFESWSLTLTEHPLNEFYSATSFADYPPGYFFVLLLVGWIFKGLAALKLISITSYPVLGVLVKLPAVFMDLVDAWLIYTIVRRFGSKAVALGAAALYALNPAAIYISASWGQVDSVSWGFVLAAISVMLSARSDETSSTSKVAWAWVLLSCSVLMKPQGVFIGLLFIAFVFTAASAAGRQRRLMGTAYGLGIGLVIAYVVSALFHGWGNPIANFAWLFGRYTFASSVYPYNSINAFNLYTIAPGNTFWTSDAQQLAFFGIPLGAMVLWGWLLVAGAAALIISRYVQRKDDRGFLEAAMLLSFALFVLATRMHERYVFGAFILMPPLIVFARRYVWTAIILSGTLLVNLAYSLHYQAVMEHPVDGLDGRNLWPITSHTLSFVNVAMFFVLGYLYLGGTIGRLGSDLAVATAPALERVSYGTTQAWARVRNWFNPAEGIISFTRLDWALAIILSVASFVVCIIAAQWPAEQYFDEVYYPRSGAEFLEGKDINGLGVFEFTHPPLTKLIIALSMIIIGHGNGLSAMGNSPLGWRFLNIVIGAITVGVLYAFAKRLTSSTLFASLAAGMLLFDGFHYVQSRISTPEITVAFFSLCTLYAFYRLWIASQVTRRPVSGRKKFRIGFGVVMAVGTLVSVGFSALLTNWRTPTSGVEFKYQTYAVIFLYFEAAFYLAARVLLPRFFPAVGHAVTYADGTQVDLDAQEKTRAVRVPNDMGSSSRAYDSAGNLTYTTPVATALFSTKGTMSIGPVRIDASGARLWFVLLSVFAAALAASKWNGLFDFFVVWGLAAIVCAQYWVPRFFAFIRELFDETPWLRPRAAVLGNPFGMPLDILVVSMLVVSGAVYAACYIPYMMLPAKHNLIDLISLQWQMYHYHATLVATHPYASKWWQWPILQKPISYYYHDFRTGIAMQSGTACCVAEILALPNPFVWWFGLLTVPIIGVLAWTERNKGYALLIVAYFLQWLPWIISPRIAFEYHFYPNLSIIVLANAIVLQRIWHWRLAGDRGERFTMPRLGVGVYAAVVVIAFIYFFPVLAGSHVTYDQWHARMWMPSWII